MKGNKKEVSKQPNSKSTTKPASKSKQQNTQAQTTIGYALRDLDGIFLIISTFGLVIPLALVMTIMSGAMGTEQWHIYIYSMLLVFSIITSFTVIKGVAESGIAAKSQWNNLSTGKKWFEVLMPAISLAVVGLVLYGIVREGAIFYSGEYVDGWWAMQLGGQYGEFWYSIY